MKEQLISFDTAKLAKEKGFNIECMYSIALLDGKIESALDMTGRLYFTKEDIECAKDNGFDVYLMPTQSLLQKWLREKYNILIGVIYWDVDDKTYSWFIDDTWSDCSATDCGDMKEYDIYEEALEKGLLEALKLIIS